MTSLGETLRRERVKRNLSLDSVSRDLKISSRLLEAIEQERFDKLPGGVFTKSFVKQYAHFLALDEDEITGELQRMIEPQPADPQLPEPRQDAPILIPRVKEWETIADKRSRWSSSLPSLALVVAVMLICSGVYSWWQRTRRPVSAREGQPVAHAAAAQPPQKPEAVKPPAAQENPEAASPTAANPAPANPAAASAGSANSAPANTGPSNSSPGNSTPGAPPQAASADAKAAPPAEPNPNAPVRVQLTATEPVWISARSDGKASFSATLAANESRVIDANSTVTLRVGNAGGITVSLNGKPLGTLGPKGQVRTVQLTSGGFQIVPPEVSKPAVPASPVGAREPLDPF